MRRAKWPEAVAVTSVAAWLIAWPTQSRAACNDTGKFVGATVDACGKVTLCDGTDGGYVFNLQSTQPMTAGDLASPDGKFTQRYNAAIQAGLCQPRPTANSCGFPDLGESFQTWLFARLATPGAKRQEAIDALSAIQRSDFGAMGTDASPDCPGGVSLKGLLTDLEQTFTNAARRGDGDAAMIGFVTALYQFRSVLPPDVFDHVLSLIDLSPKAGSVETLSFGADPLTVCPPICALTCSNPVSCAICAGACVASVEAERLTVPETENHRNMIYVSQYLANQLWFEKTGDPKYDNAQNGYRALMLNRLKDFVRNDFVEYNSHNYQDYTMIALLPLASYAADPPVKQAATDVLNYVAAKVTVSSNDARRSTPFRRRDEPEHNCAELVEQDCTDPQTSFFMMLAGVTDILQQLADILPVNTAPGTYPFEFLWAGTTQYRIDPVILDLFVDRSHRNFYQFFHYSRPLETDGFNDSNDELYFGSPSYLIAAGGHKTHYAYTADVPFPISLIVSHLGSDTDIGVMVPTVLMPTNASHSRDQMIAFFDPDPTHENMCVAPNFACGLKPPNREIIPGDYPIDPNNVVAAAGGVWSFIDKSAAAGQFGYYAAVYQQGNFGFLEVYDTYTNPSSLTGFTDFKNRVLTANGGAGNNYSLAGVNSYITIDGSVIQFTPDAKIVSINGHPPYDPNRTNGTIINNDGQGTVTISNPALNKTLTLDATQNNHPGITVPGPLVFPDTCVGSTSTTTLTVCNGANGSDNLFVYNILSPSNTEFSVTEPTSGYPTAIGAPFCFPFQAQFTPTQTGTISAKLTISNSDPTAPEMKLAVSGNGIQQGIATLIANAGSFGNVCVGSFSDLNMTINNSGGCDLVVTGITSSSPDFLVPVVLSFPLTLHAGDSLQVPVRYQPTHFGPSAPATITVASNDPKNPTSTMPVSGTAPPPVIAASIVDNGSFGNVCAGMRSDIALQVLNQGLCPLTISSISSTWGPVGGASFVLPAVTYPLVLGASASVMLPVSFQPPAYGSANYITCSDTAPQTATLVIHSNDPSYPDPGGFTRPVSGIEGCPKLVLSPQNLTGAFAFPATVSDPNGTRGCYTDRQITAGNSGQCPLTIASLSTSNGFDGKGVALPASPLEFTVVNPTAPITISPGAAPVPITVRFRPVVLTDQNGSAPDQQTGSLSIVSNDPAPADNAASLCGEPTVQSGARVLLVDSSNVPVNQVQSITLASKGMTPPFSQTIKPAAPLSANVCGTTIVYHLDNETLRPAATTGNNPKASYTLTAKNGSTQANASFTLGQCQMQQLVLQLR